MENYKICSFTEFSDYCWKIRIAKTINKLSFQPRREIMNDEKIEAKSEFVKLPEESNKLINSLGFRNTYLPDNLIVATILFKNDLIVLRSLLDFGLDPNGKLFAGTYIVHLCATVEMLQLLIQYGLDLKRNNPLLRVPFPVFIEMILRYRVDPWKDYEFIDDFRKVHFLNTILIREKRELSKVFIESGFLIDNLSETIINRVFPIVRSF